MENKAWKKEESKELMSFIKAGLKKGLEIRYLCEQYIETHPGLTREQVRAHYYQILNNPKDTSKYKKGPWSIEEKNFLFNFVEESKKNMSMLEIFAYVGEELNRNPRAVSSQYYFVKKQEKELDSFLYKLDNLNISKIDNLLGKLKEIRSYSEKEKEILKLREKNISFANQINKLQNQLTLTKKTLSLYQEKIHNNKKL